MDVGQPEIAPLVLERQSLMIDTQTMQHRCVEIMDVNGILGNVVAEIIGPP